MSEVGRPTVFDELTLQKLEEAFLLGCSDLEACFVANISSSSLYNYQRENPEFLQRKQQMKEYPTYLARQSVIKGFKDGDLALKYLERKKKDEFSIRQELTGKDGGAIEMKPIFGGLSTANENDRIQANNSDTENLQLEEKN